MTAQTDSRIAAWLTLFLFGVYLLSFSGQLYSQDSMSMFSVTESFVKRGEFNTDQLWTLFKARNEIAPDGESYAKYGYGMSLFAVPLYALAFALNLGLTQTTLLTSSIVIALTAALVFLSARRLKFSRGVSLITALLFGLATPAWVYAKQFWSEPYALFTLFAAFYFLQCFRDEQNARDGLIAGIALGLAAATRVTNVALVPAFVWYGFVVIDPHTQTSAQKQGHFLSALGASIRWRGVIPFALAVGGVALSVVWYDAARYGSPLATGYRADETFDNPFLLGAYGLLFSPGRGLFVYMPFLAALIFSMPLFFRRAKRETILIVCTFIFYLVLFSTWYYWWGGTNWGARFLVPTIPFLVLLTAPAIELGLTGKQKIFSLVFAGLGLLALYFQLLGVAFPSLAFRLRLVRSSPTADWDSIFVPQFSPLIGYLNLKLNALDLAWIRITDTTIAMDWLVVVLTLAFIVLAGLSLRAFFAKQSPIRLSEITLARTPLAVMTILVVALALFSLYRYRDDARWGAGDGYRALAQTLTREEQPRDVLILDDDARAGFFFNANYARLRWYGLSRDPNQFDDATRNLLERLAQNYARVWFAYDDATQLDDPTRAWLEHALPVTAQFDYSDGVHLILFAR